MRVKRWHHRDSTPCIRFWDVCWGRFENEVFCAILVVIVSSDLEAFSGVSGRFGAIQAIGVHVGFCSFSASANTCIVLGDVVLEIKGLLRMFHTFWGVSGCLGVF